jgi:hypothetical protein
VPPSTVPLAESRGHEDRSTRTREDRVAACLLAYLLACLLILAWPWSLPVAAPNWA